MAQRLSGQTLLPIVPLLCHGVENGPKMPFLRPLFMLRLLLTLSVPCFAHLTLIVMNDTLSRCIEHGDRRWGDTNNKAMLSVVTVL